MELTQEEGYFTFLDTRDVVVCYDSQKFKVGRRYKSLVVTILGALALIVFHYTKNNEANFRQNTVYRVKQCTNILEILRSGKWREKQGLTDKDKQTRYRMDLSLREFRGIPVLTRTDLQCGTGFPVSAPKFGQSLPAECDRAGIKPCCNENIGLCGSGPENCKCSKCTDFQTVISAELFDWVPLNKTCEIKTHESRDACEIVSSRLTNLIIVGDSLMRHFSNALLLLFTGDFTSGAQARASAATTDCSGERQFVDSGRSMCHEKLARTREDTNKEFCKDLPYFGYKFNESYSINHAGKVMELVRDNLGRRSLIVIGIGLHDGLSAQRTINNFLEPILQLVEDADWPKILWVTTHAQGFVKPLEFRRKQGNHRVLAFNEKIHRYLTKRNIPVFDVYPMTSGVYSYDGTHYGIGVNLLKARMLVNYIEDTF
ncbi:predicted protein [Nematostella vectensis]|uniref:SGNH domain-containing protein n=1 Tax=Nematostella vectensis TaxID=45351 RepID=A7RV16_NEMVE|nr:predicted protein [Nematostella vectensis]|eukprot:XP_001636772.1 predicted protein [Nematostella vectensis]